MRKKQDSEKSSVNLRRDILQESQILAIRRGISWGMLVEQALYREIAEAGVKLPPLSELSATSLYWQEKRKAGLAKSDAAIKAAIQKEAAENAIGTCSECGGIAYRSMDINGEHTVKCANGCRYFESLPNASPADHNAELNGILEGLAQAQKGQSKPIEEIRERLKE